MTSIFGKVMWIGRATVLTVGLAVVLAVMFGVATTALAAVPGDPLKLGKANVVNRVTALIKRGPGPALSLKVGAGQPPLAVNSTGKISSLNADQLDGKDSAALLGKSEKAADSDRLDGKSVEQVGVNGLQRVPSASPSNSDSPKRASVKCPPGKVLTGSGGYIVGGTTGASPNAETAVSITVIDAVPESGDVVVTAFEDEPFVGNWTVVAVAVCANAP